MKSYITLALIAITLSFAACSEKPKGDPATVATMQKIADAGCECQDKDCLFNVKVDGKSYVSARMSSTKNMTDAEKTAFNAAIRKFGDCEMKITNPQ